MCKAHFGMTINYMNCISAEENHVMCIGQSGLSIRVFIKTLLQSFPAICTEISGERILLILNVKRVELKRALLTRCQDQVIFIIRVFSSDSYFVEKPQTGYAFAIG